MNKIRIQTRKKCGLAKLDEVCDEFNLHVEVHDIEATNCHYSVRVNNKKYFGSSQGQSIEFNLYKGHYFIEKRTIYTSDYIKHKYILKEDVPFKIHNCRYTHNRWIKTSG